MLQENLSNFILKAIRNNWKNKALADYQGKTYTYGDVAGYIIHLHTRFEMYGIQPGDKIALLGKNSAHWAISYLAVITYGAVVVTILPDFKPGDVHHIVNHSDSGLLLAADALFENLDPEKMEKLKGSISLKDFSILADGVAGSLSDKAEAVEDLYQEKYPFGTQSDNFFLKPVHNDHLAVISYTSGTTGFTKGVMLPHNSLVANIVYANKNMPLDSGDAIVSFLPLAHAYGCTFEFLWPFTLGCHITFLTKTPSPEIIVKAFREIKPRLVLAVPLIIEKIYKKQIMPVINKPVMKRLLHTPLLKTIIHKRIKQKLADNFGGNFHEVVIGGAPLNAEVEHFLKKIRFPYSIGYGMTECGPLISYANRNQTRLGASGKIVDTLEAKISSEDAHNMVGEILVRGENLMMGYYKNKEATEKVIDQDGWFHTGDLGLFDEDGYLYIKGRSKSMILGPSGQNIYPEELEARLNNLPFIQESLVVEKNGKLVALIYPDYEETDQKGLDEKALKKLLDTYKTDINNLFPDYMSISSIKIVPEEFAKTPKKSIKRFLYTINH
ncbi:MAG: long-chain fatty acid--CoA ligase [Bacteroidia bacterium]|nr:MAG: long-chain fatty acid--CoA ligase [Bacteroidia bacterium]